MASKKISYNDLKKQNDGSQLAQALAGGKTIVSQNTGFEKVKIEDIIEDPKGDFTEIFSFNEDAAKAIADSMITKGYDKTQVIHLAKIREEPETMEKPIRIDGAHRVAGAKMAGIDEIPAYIHTFDTRTEALIYAYELQVLRRNLEPYQKLDAMAKLDQLKNPGKKADGESTGKSSEEIADVLGVSTRTAERMRNIINNADEETIEAVKNGEMSISKADKLTNEKKKPKTKPKPNQSEDDVSEALDGNEGKPSGLNFTHTDGIERPDNKISNEEDSERTKERRAAYETGFTEGFLQAAEYIISQLKKDIFLEEVEKELNKTKKTYEKLVKLQPKNEEPVQEEYDGQDLPFEDETESVDKNNNEDTDSSFDISFAEN